MPTKVTTAPSPNRRPTNSSSSLSGRSRSGSRRTLISTPRQKRNKGDLLPPPYRQMLGSDRLIDAGPDARIAQRLPEQLAPAAQRLTKVGDRPTLSRRIALHLAPALLANSSNKKDFHHIIFRLSADPWSFPCATYLPGQRKSFV